MTTEELHNIISQGENTTTEFKSSFSNETIETITAFANTKGGTVVIGISDKKEITGTTIGIETILKVTNEIKTKTSPALYPDIETLIVENKELLIIYLQEYPIKPVSFKGRYFKRVGASNHVMQAEEIAEQHILSVRNSFDSIEADCGIDDLNQNLIDSFFNIIRNNGRYNTFSDNRLNLEKLGIYKSCKTYTCGPTFIWRP